MPHIIAFSARPSGIMV